MEWGTVGGITQAWTRVPLGKHYSHPVIVVKPVSDNGADPGVIRVRNVTGDSFELKYNEWSYLDGNHFAPEQVFYLVAEAGTQTVGGLTVQAGTLTTQQTAKRRSVGSRQLPRRLPERPGRLHRSDEHPGADPVITRVKNVSPSGFDLTMQEEEGKNDGHIDETLGWIAITKGEATTEDGRSLKVLDAQASSGVSTVDFGQSFSRRYPVSWSGRRERHGTGPLRASVQGPHRPQRRPFPPGGAVGRQRDGSHSGEPVDIPWRIGIF